jgi:hypothetical protein
MVLTAFTLKTLEAKPQPPPLLLFYVLYLYDIYISTYHNIFVFSSPRPGRRGLNPI